MIPSKAVLQSLRGYLLKLGFAMPTEIPAQDQKSMWAQLRSGSLDGFEVLVRSSSFLTDCLSQNYSQQDGIQRDYTLLCSPHFKDQHPSGNSVDNIHRPYHNFPSIRTHVSPFAISIHALRVLECPDSPMSFNSDKIIRAREAGDFDQIQNLVEHALLGLGVAETKPDLVPRAVQDHARAFVDFVMAFDRRVVTCLSSSSRSSKSVTSSSLPRRGSISDNSSHYSLRSRSHRDTAQRPSTPTPSARSLGDKTRKKKCSSSPTPASQIQENYRATHPSTSDSDYSLSKGLKLIRRIISHSSPEGSPKFRLLVTPKGLFSSVPFIANGHFGAGKGTSGK